MVHEYFTDRELGPKPKVEQEFSTAAWGGIVALLTRLINNGSFGLDFPEQCPDGHEIIGTDSDTFWMALRAEVPGMPESLGDDAPPAPVIMDLLEFCCLHVADPIQGSNHSYFQHHHLSFNQEHGRANFRGEVNRLLARNGLAFELRKDGHATRLAPPVLRESLTLAIFNSGDADLDGLLEAARSRFLSPDPDTRRESLEKLWDAWERLKTIEAGKDKKARTARMLEIAASEESLRSALNVEAQELTRIGNSFQIRHRETNQVRLACDEHVDYLFHRLFAFINLVLVMRGKPENAAGL